MHINAPNRWESRMSWWYSNLVVSDSASSDVQGRTGQYHTSVPCTHSLVKHGLQRYHTATSRRGTLRVKSCLSPGSQGGPCLRSVVMLHGHEMFSSSFMSVHNAGASIAVVTVSSSHFQGRVVGKGSGGERVPEELGQGEEGMDMVKISIGVRVSKKETQYPWIRNELPVPLPNSSRRTSSMDTAVVPYAASPSSFSHLNNGAWTPWTQDASKADEDALCTRSPASLTLH